jgi:hypothetical protein
MGLVVEEVRVVDDLLHAYRDLVGHEARLAEALAPEGLRLRASVAEQWPVVHDHLQLYARGLGRGGVLVLAGAPDAGSRLTGIPFTGPREARERLGLDAPGDAASPAGAAFWAALGEAPPSAVFNVAHLAHAVPFDVPPHAALRDAARRHVLGLLAILRPQAVVPVGALALRTLGHALGQRDLADLAQAPEAAWLARWPPGTPPLRAPGADVPLRPPFRVRLLPVPDLAGGHAAAAGYAVQRLLERIL